MRQTTKWLALVGAAPLAAFGINIGGSLGLETGYRWDTFKSTSTLDDLAVVEKIDHLGGATVGLNGRLTLDDAYIRANGSYMKTLSTPQFVITTDGDVDVNVSLTKEHGYDGCGAAGYNFYFNQGEFSLAPEVGFAYSALGVAPGTTQSIASPFVGFDFNWIFSTDWKFGFLFDFHFLGFRKSEILTDSNATATITDSKYMGPEAKLAFDYSFTENWSMGFAYRFKYVITGKEDNAGFIGEKQAWMTNSATLKVDYMF